MSVRPDTLVQDGTSIQMFATQSDHEECRRLHRRYGSTYYFATGQFHPSIRRRVHALYGFVRVPDEWVDNPGGRTDAEVCQLLGDYRSELLRGVDGVCPTHPVLRAFCDVMREVQMPTEEPLLFLDAMRSDLTVSRYQTFDDLNAYMRGSAASVGVMMCSVLDAHASQAVLEAAKAMGTAMQLTNILRDVGEDARRGRIYLPMQELESFGVCEQDIMEGRMSDRFVRLMQFQTHRTRELYELADTGIVALPKQARKAVRLARILYSRILDRIEQQHYNVFQSRAHTTRTEKLLTALRVLVTG